MAIKNVTVGTTNTELYASTGNNAITTIIVCNIATFNPASPTSDQTYLYLYAVPSADVSGTTTSTKHTLINKLPIPAGETVTFDQEKVVLANGDTLFIKSDSPANLVATISTLAV